MSEERKKPLVKIPAKFQNMVLFMHHRCPDRVEWSGPLIYQVLEGSIADPGQLVISVEGFYPMNVGNSSYTEFDSGSEMMEMLELWPQVDPLTRNPAWMTGLIHTHHGMSTFFSDVDHRELDNNSKKFPYYLSLIVNYDGKYSAKIGLAGLEETKTVKSIYVKTLDQRIETVETNQKDIVYKIDCDVELEAPTWLKDKAEVILRPKPATQPTYGREHYRGSQWDYQTNSWKDPEKAKEEAPKASVGRKLKSVPAEYLKVLPLMTNLLSLGIQYDSTTPSWTFDKVGILLSFTQIEEYTDAILAHFFEDWGQGTITSKIDDATLLVCIDQFIDLQSEGWFKSKWKNKILPELYAATTDLSRVVQEQI